MADPVRIVFGNSNEGVQAQGDDSGNLFVREGFIDEDNQVYEDTSFVVGDSPAVHDFYTDAGRYANDGYITCDGVGDIQVDISREGLTYGDKFVLKSGEKASLLRMKISKIRVTHTGTDSAYRINLI
jgi:hypothetical protein